MSSRVLLPDTGLGPWLQPGRHFPSPDWERVGNWAAEHVPEADVHAFWAEVAVDWMERVRDGLGGAYRVRRGGEFLLLVACDEDRAGEVLQCLNRVLREIRERLRFLGEERGLGLLPVVALGSLTDFYRYLADYTQVEGEYAAVGGVYINQGYGHFAFPGLDLARCRETLIHETAHAVLAAHALPMWLDEALVAFLERSLLGASPYALDRETVRRHRAYWTAGRIQGFWRGETFWSPDEGQELSYHLAAFLLEAAAGRAGSDLAQLAEFVRNADRLDGGAAAAIGHLDLAFGEVLEGLLGPGDWEPRPSGTGPSDRGEAGRPETSDNPIST